MKLEWGSIHLYSSHDLGRLACGISRGSPGLVLAQCLGLVSASRVHVLAYNDGDIGMDSSLGMEELRSSIRNISNARLLF